MSARDGFTVRMDDGSSSVVSVSLTFPVHATTEQIRRSLTSAYARAMAELEHRQMREAS